MSYDDLVVMVIAVIGIALIIWGLSRPIDDEVERFEWSHRR